MKNFELSNGKSVSLKRIGTMIRTGEAIIGYNAIGQPDSKTKKYSVEIFCEYDENFIMAVREACKKSFEVAKKGKLIPENDSLANYKKPPYKDNAIEKIDKDFQEELKDMVKLRPDSKYPFAVYDENGRLLNDSIQSYIPYGTKASVIFQVKAYDAAGKKGFTVYIDKILIERSSLQSNTLSFFEDGTELEEFNREG